MLTSVSLQGRKDSKGYWLIKKAKSEFKVNPYIVAKNVLDPKCYCSLKVDQETLDQHKSFILLGNTYNIRLDDLEGLSPELAF